MLSGFQLEWKPVERFLIVLGAVIALCGLFLTWSELRSVRLNQSAELTLHFDDALSTPTALQIMQAIEDGRPILKSNKGKFERWQLDAYLGAYETIYNLYSNGLISEDMLYSAFSYNLVQAGGNKEIAAYIESVQKNDPSIFAGFQDLVAMFRVQSSGIR